MYTKDKILCNKVQRPVKATLSVHVLSVFPFQNDMNCTHIVSLYFFSFSAIEITKSHHSHHLLFFGCLALKICFYNIKTETENSIIYVFFIIIILNHSFFLLYIKSTRKIFTCDNRSFICRFWFDFVIWSIAWSITFSWLGSAIWPPMSVSLALSVSFSISWFYSVSLYRSTKSYLTIKDL